MMIRRIAALAISTAFLIPAVATAAETPKQGGTAVMAIPAEPTGITRNLRGNTADGTVGCIIYQGLTRISAKGEVVPLLAKSWEVSQDGKTYSFVLQDAAWQDGKPLTSHDVKYTLLEVSAKYSSAFSRVAAHIEGIDTPSDKEVVIKLKRPYGPLLNALTCPAGSSILPAHVFEGKDVLTNPALQQPVGLGPFVLKEWVKGSHLTLERNPNYWEEGKPYLDGMIIQIMPNSASRLQALISGDVDILAYFGVDMASYPQIESTPSLVLTPVHKPAGTDMIKFNVETKVLSDKRVRQALFMALDRKFLVQAAFQGVGPVGIQPFSTDLGWAREPSIDYNTMYPFDPERANKLLDEAGYPRGSDGNRFSVRFMYMPSWTGGQEIAGAVTNMWGAVGVKVELEVVEAATAVKRVYEEGNFDAFLIGLINQGDPALGLAQIYTSSSIGGIYGNASRYRNDAVDALFAKGEEGATLEDRAPFYKEVQTLIAEDLPVLNLHDQLEYGAQSATLKGLEDEAFLATWRDAWLDR